MSCGTRSSRTSPGTRRVPVSTTSTIRRLRTVPGDGNAQASVYYHHLGTAQTDDTHIYTVADHPTPQSLSGGDRRRPLSDSFDRRTRASKTPSTTSISSSPALPWSNSSTVGTGSISVIGNDRAARSTYGRRLARRLAGSLRSISIGRIPPDWRVLVPARRRRRSIARCSRAAR